MEPAAHDLSYSWNKTAFRNMCILIFNLSWSTRRCTFASPLICIFKTPFWACRQNGRLDSAFQRWCAFVACFKNWSSWQASLLSAFAGLRLWIIVTIAMSLPPLRCHEHVAEQHLAFITLHSTVPSSFGLAIYLESSSAERYVLE